MDQIKPKRIDRRKNRVCVRLSPKQAKKIAKLMQKSGKSRQKLMKEALLSRTDLVTPLYTEEQANTFLIELKQVGERLNQFAKELNSGTMNGWSAKIKPFVHDFVRLRMMLTGHILLVPTPIAATGPQLPSYE